MLLVLCSFALAAPPTVAELHSFGEALAAQGSIVMPGGPPPPGGTGVNKLDVYQRGDLVILEDDDGEWFADALAEATTGNINWILDSTSGAFYKNYADEYDFVCLMMVQDLGFFVAFYSPMSNDVLGIGYDSITPGEQFDQSSTRMQGYIFMNYYGLWADNPEAGRYVFGQEFLHRWGAFVNVDHPELDSEALLGRDTAHWSYWLHTPNSPMEGNSWVDNGDGTWSVDPGATSTYSDLDLYVMGLVGPEAVGPQTLLLVDEAEQSSVSREAASTPEAFAEMYGGTGSAVTVTASPVSFTLDDIIAAEGERVPSVDDSPKTFKMAFLVLVLDGDDASDAVLDDIDGLRQTFEADWEADVQNLADLDTTLGEGDAPLWGEPQDSGDSAALDTSDNVDNDAKLAKGCGCATGGIEGAGLLLVGTALLRRRR